MRRHFRGIAAALLLAHGAARADTDIPPVTATTKAEAKAEAAHAAEQREVRRQARTELLWELDAYYSSLSLEIPLSDAPLPDGGALSEPEVYRQLFRHSLRPQLLMLEASVYPMPMAGTWFKKHHPSGYAAFDIANVGGNQLNLIDGLTAGFQEPWALSVFAGSAMSFSPRADSDNRGYMGYLLSYGAKHIRNNVLIDDDWWELEWKLKGERERMNDDLSWSFRLGVKNHGTPDIRDVAYIALRRSHLDYNAPLLAFLNNANLEFKTEVERRHFRFLRQELTVGYNIPLRAQGFALTLDTGFIYESQDKYTGPLADPAADNFTIVFRPNIKF
jgi:hypothetical protein